MKKQVKACGNIWKWKSDTSFIRGFGLWLTFGSNPSTNENLSNVVSKAFCMNSKHDRHQIESGIQYYIFVHNSYTFTLWLHDWRKSMSLTCLFLWVHVFAMDFKWEKWKSRTAGEILKNVNNTHKISIKSI